MFKQFCDNLLWPCLQLRYQCVQLGIHEDLLRLVDKLLASLFHRLVLCARTEMNSLNDKTSKYF